jgi:hypothetical protein
MYSKNDSGPDPQLMGADILMGNDVYNKHGEDQGDKLFAVPWSALALDTTNKRFTLNVEKDALQSAPGFYKDSRPGLPWSSPRARSTTSLTPEMSR